MYGQVFDFINTPYQLIFDYSIESKQRKMFEERVKNLKSGLFWKCSAKINGQEKKVNTFKITVDQINQIHLNDELFGNASQVFVTRNQLTNLAQKFMTNVNIYMKIIK